MRKMAILLVILMVIGVGLLSGCNEQQKIKENDAYSFYKECVLDVLKAPATAQFPSIEKATIVKKGENRWGVVSYVDAENTYGALIRNYFGFEFTESEGVWYILSMYEGEDFSDVDHALYRWVLVDKFTDNDYNVVIGGTSGDTEGLKKLDTNFFYISGERWRADWERSGKMSSDSLIGPMLIINSNGPTGKGILVYDSTEYGSYVSGTEYIYDGGDYYSLSISSINVLGWSIEVYEGIKCE